MARTTRQRERQRGSPSQYIGIRCPEDLLQAIDAAGKSKTEGVVRLLDLAVDVMRAMGDGWPEVEVLAIREGCTEGEALAKLALAGMGKRK